MGQELSVLSKTPIICVIIIALSRSKLLTHPPRSGGRISDLPGEPGRADRSKDTRRESCCPAGAAFSLIQQLNPAAVLLKRFELGSSNRHGIKLHLSLNISSPISEMTEKDTSICHTCDLTRLAQVSHSIFTNFCRAANMDKGPFKASPPCFSHFISLNSFLITQSCFIVFPVR